MSKYQHLTPQEMKEWETIFTAISVLKHQIQLGFDSLQYEMKQVFAEVRHAKTSHE